MTFSLAYNECKLHKTIDLEINFDFLEKGQGIVFFYHILCLFFQEKCFSYYILINDQISLCNCLYSLRNWVICVLQMLVNQAVTS